MDVQLIGDVARGRVYQGAAPDEGITTFQTKGRMLMLVEMAAGVDALKWVRQGNLRSVLYFGIDDTPRRVVLTMRLLKHSRSVVGRGYAAAAILFSGARPVSHAQVTRTARL